MTTNDNLGKNVFRLDVQSDMDLPPNRVLTSALNELQEVIVIGRDMNDGLYCASSSANIDKVVGLLDNGKNFIQRCY
jgi:hypothetical protein